MSGREGKSDYGCAGAFWDGVRYTRRGIRMLDSIKVGNFIMEKRKSLGMTQQQLADKLNISFQAISKWENGD